MRKFLATIITVFAKLITFPLHPMRGMEARVIAAERLTAIVPIETGSGRLLFGAHVRQSFKRARQFHMDEPDTLAWIDELDAGSCLWDIGANVGVYSLYAALRPQTRVLAFEPAGANYATLNRNIELNHMSSRVTAYCIALSGETKLDVLAMTNTMAGYAMHGFGTEIDQFNNAIPAEFFQGAIGFCIDDFVAMLSPPMPTHVKIDVDGIEADILRGGRRTFSAPSVTSMIIEIQGIPGSTRKREVVRLMTELGFVARPVALPEYRNVIFDR